MKWGWEESSEQRVAEGKNQRNIPVFIYQLGSS
jgi:hypothetical protein